VNFLWFLRFHLAAVTLSASYLSIDNDKWIKMKDTIHWDGPLLSTKEVVFDVSR